MARFNSPLDNVRVASPCNADWDQMIGNERARFCGQCNLSVYNLSSMTKGEAEQLIGATEGRLCVRYFNRADGSILTRDCPVGLRAFRRKMSYVARAVSSAVLSLLAGLGVYQVKSNFLEPTIMGGIAVESHPQVLMRDIADTRGGDTLGEIVVDTPAKPKPPVRRRGRPKS